eukprot:TRINITY_DN14503_c0_g1_i1.p2 TRINITY_DN14503_c0_g1~~TRINITY_DN14503_c0_g1_i1.p2  ORF type:complete len:152 (+),score=50.18 TRINITY_DN14503_c0_g1_i1:108-563(+)
MSWDGGGKAWGGKGGGKWDMMQAMMTMMGGKGGWGGGKGWEGGKDGKGGKGWEGGKGFGKYDNKGPGSWGDYKIDETGGVLGEFTGTIKSFSDKNGYGFIDSDDLKAMGYQDVFMHGDMKRGFRKGQTVKFTAFLTGKGQVQSKELKSGLK